MNQDNSIQAVLFRIRRGADTGQQLKSLKAYQLQMYGYPTKPSTGKVPTIVGKRNGIPVGADQDTYQLQR